MRVIKFRGEPIDVGEKYTRKKFIIGYYFAEDERHYIIAANSETYEVCADSVVQLIGVDKNGKEIYEGDKIYIGTRRFTATFNEYKKIAEGRIEKCE